MGFLNIFFISFVCCWSLLSAGKLFNNIIVKDNEDNFFENIILGFIFLSFLALLINFFFSLNEHLNLIFLFFPVFIYLFIIKKEIKKDIKYLTLLSILCVILISLENTNRPDAGLYHLPYINILNESNLIIGLSNLHFRYGHISIIQYISAIYNNSIFTDNGILVPTAVIYLALLGYLIKEIFTKKDDKFYSFCSAIFASYTLINMNRYSSWGNDDFASIMAFIIFLNCYKNYQTFNIISFSKIILFCSLTFLIKSFYLIIFLLPLIIFYKNFKKLIREIFFNKVIIFSYTFIFLWLIKNFLISSCLVFPVTFLCFDIFSWSLNENFIKNISIISEAWAKDWPNNVGNKNYEGFIGNFNWFETWIKNHFLIIVKNISVLIILIIIFKTINIPSLNKFQKKFINTFSLIFCILFLIWLYKFPLLRYGEGIVVIFLLLISFYIKLPTLKINSYKFSLIIIILLSIAVVGKNLSRIVKNFENNYIDYPWPKKNTYTSLNVKNKYIAHRKNGILLYYSPKVETNLCMYGSAPCAAIGVNESYSKIEKIEINKGKFIIFDVFYIINKS